MRQRVYTWGPTEGVRELRQKLSRYMHRVARGERLEVTERGKPVAVFGPVDECRLKPRFSRFTL